MNSISKKIFTKMLGFLFAFSILSAGSNISISAAAAGSDLDSPITVSKLNKNVTGKLTKDEISIYYVFTVPKTSRVTIHVSSSSIKESLSMMMYNGDYEELMDKSYSYNSKTGKISGKWAEYMTAGTYYLRFYSKMNDAAGSFTFKVSDSNVKTNDKEPNNSLEKAQTVALNKTYTGLMTMTDRKDVYKFTLKKEQNIGINVSSTYTGVLKIQVSKKEDSLFNNVGSSTYSASQKSGNPYKYQEVLSPGTYYITIEGENNTGKYKLETIGY